MTQNLKDLGQPLGLVDDYLARVSIKESFEIGSQQSDVGRAVEIEMRPTREHMTYQRALSALAGADEEHGRKRPEKGAKTLCLLPIDILHVLQFCIVSSKIQVV